MLKKILCQFKYINIEKVAELRILAVIAVNYK